MARTNKSVPLGSGRCYVVKLEKNMTLQAPDLVALCKNENLLGETTGGASLSYSVNIHKEQDDHGVLIRTIITDEEAKLKLGVFSWNNDTLAKLSATARKVKEGDYDVLIIGGLDNDDGAVYVVIFKQIDSVLGDLYVAIVGTNTAGLSLAFARNNTTKLEPEFTAQPCDDKGGLVKMFEGRPGDAEPQGEAQSEEPQGEEPQGE